MDAGNSLIRYFVQSLRGAWELIRCNPKGIDYFDQSADGFWKSFWAIALVFPVFLLGLSVSNDLAVAEGHVIPLAAYIIDFLLQLPLTAVVMIFFTRFLKVDTYYTTMIIAYNWLWVMANYIILPLSILVSLGMIPPNAGTLLVMGVATYLELYVTWFLFKHALKISGWLAFSVMAFNSVFALSMMQLIIWLFR